MVGIRREILSTDMSKKDIYALSRIELLVTLVMVIFFVTFILDIYRCRSRSPILHTVLKTVDNLSDHVVVYLIGAMQSARLRNHLFPVWGIVLVSLRSNLGYLSGYGISDRERRLAELANVIHFMGVGFLNSTHGAGSPVWWLWAILLVRSIYRCYSHHRAIKSLWHGRSSEFLPQHMHPMSRDSKQGNRSASTPQQKNNIDDDLACDPARNIPRYIVYGESSQKMILERPGYNLHLHVVHPGSLITLDKIMECTEPLLGEDNGYIYKEMALAFALSRLLRCKFEDVPLHKETIHTTKNLIKSIISGDHAAATVPAAAEMVAAEVVEATTLAAAEMVAAEVVEATTLSAVEVIMETIMVMDVDASPVGTTIEMALLEPETQTAAETMIAAEETSVMAPDAVLTAEAMEAETPSAVVVAESAAETALEIHVEGSKTAQETTMVSVAVTTTNVAPAECAFRILELELAFARDYFYTLYPLVFWKGLGSLCISLLLSMLSFAMALFLALLVYPRLSVDVLLTWVFLSFMMIKEVWEIVTYLLSNWTRLLLVCKYVKTRIWYGFMPLLFMYNIADPWHGRIDQYDFLRSFTYKPSLWKLANNATLGTIPEKLDGHKSGDAIKMPECVKPAILEALRRIGLDNPQLPREIPSLSGSVEQFAQYSWASLDIDTCSQVILVWHIATSLCEVKLAQECEVDLTNPSFLSSAWSYLKTFIRDKPFLVNKNIHLTGELETDYHTATSLSRYCAYLQVFQSELLPDRFTIPKLIFEETLEDARKQLGDCDLIWCVYTKLMVIAQETAENNQEVAQTNVDMRLRMSIVQQGATLGKGLIRMDKNTRWKILAGVWADLLVHIAPSWNPLHHKNNLESGGEFLTLIWALLSHCGIEKSTLWDKDEAPQRNSEVDQENNNETSIVHPVAEQQVPESNAQVPHDEDGIESDQETEISYFTRRRRPDARTDTAQNETEANEDISPSSSTANQTQNETEGISPRSFTN